MDNVLKFVSTDLAVLISAIYLLSLALICKTDNLLASMIYKVFPFFLGLSLLLGLFYK